jgi:tetratricopeptide (TPR) repeat protein
MFRYKALALALTCAGLAGTTWVSTTYLRPAAQIDPLLTSSSNCVVPGKNGATLKRYLQLAAATNELKPFNRATDAPSGILDEVTDVPLRDDLGSLNYRIGTPSLDAQRYFDQGLKLAYAFNHAEARRAFRKAQSIDPRCAMCYWGEAFVLGPNINAPMEVEANPPALEAIRQAQRLAPKASEKEQALIDALAARYSADPKAERGALDAAFAQRMEAVAKRWPKDDLLALVYAEALMDLQPWDYWEAGGTRHKGRAGEIIALVEGVLQRNPDHPGALHFYLHLLEASSNPQKAEPYADRLGPLMPGAGHLVHMPSHIYYRVGRYIDSLEANRKAVQVDERYLNATAGVPPIYAQGYYPHNVHFLMVSAQMAGDGDTAIEAAGKLARVVTEEGARAIPWVQPIKAAPYFTHAQFSAPQRILQLDDPGDALPYVKAIWHYARGVAFAAQAEGERAEAELQSIKRIAATGDFQSLEAGGVPAHDVLGIAERVLRGRIAQLRGDLPTAIAALQAAVAIEDQLAYMEPPYWYYPVRQSLGGLLTLAGRLDEAEQILRESLARAPNNGWALWGLQQVYEKRGDHASARALDQRLSQAWVGRRTQLDLARI